MIKDITLVSHTHTCHCASIFVQKEAQVQGTGQHPHHSPHHKHDVGCKVLSVIQEEGDPGRDGGQQVDAPDRSEHVVDCAHAARLHEEHKAQEEHISCRLETELHCNVATSCGESSVHAKDSQKDESGCQGVLPVEMDNLQGTGLLLNNLLSWNSTVN